MMKHKLGDKVIIRNDLTIKEIYGTETFENPMYQYCGKTATITRVGEYTYSLDIDKGAWYWTDEMFVEADDDTVKPAKKPKSKKQKVYVVVSGEYSDKIIEAVFSTLEKAEHYVANAEHNDCWGEPYYIRDFELDGTYFEDTNEIWYRHTFNICNDTIQTHVINPVIKSDVRKDKVASLPFDKATYYYETYDPNREIPIKNIMDRFYKSLAEKENL